MKKVGLFVAAATALGFTTVADAENLKMQALESRLDNACANLTASDTVNKCTATAYPLLVEYINDTAKGINHISNELGRENISELFGALGRGYATNEDEQYAKNMARLTDELRLSSKELNQQCKIAFQKADLNACKDPTAQRQANLLGSLMTSCTSLLYNIHDNYNRSSLARYFETNPANIKKLYGISDQLLSVGEIPAPTQKGFNCQ